MPFRQPLVVVVEDDADMNQAMESVLRAAGFEAAMFSSAEAVLEAGIPANTTCLVLDVHLPGMSGFELYERLNAVHRSPPVVFMTAYDEPSARAQSQAAKAVAYLTKPFAGRRLIEIVDGVFQSKS